jgi:hypothetical protein
MPPPEFITGEKDGTATKEPNPAYDSWVAMDQHILSFLVNTLSPDILVTTIGMETAAEVWGGNQGDVCLPFPDTGLKSPRRPRTDEEGQHDDGAILQQDEELRRRASCSRPAN